MLLAPVLPSSSIWEMHCGDYMVVGKASATGDTGDHFCADMLESCIGRYQNKWLYHAKKVSAALQRSFA